MREYGKLATRFWTDPSILGLPSHAKLVFVYLLAGAETNAIGCFRITAMHLAASDVCTAPEGHSAFLALSKAGLIEYDEAASVVLIPNFLKYNPICNESTAKAAVKATRTVPDSPLLAKAATAAADMIEGSTYGKSFDTAELRSYGQVPTPVQAQVPTQVPTQVGTQVSPSYSDSESDSDTDSEHKSARAPEPARPPGPDPDPSPPPQPERPHQPGEAYELAELLIRLLAEGNEGFRPPPIADPWARHIAELHVRERRPWSEIEQVMRWALTESAFWRGRVANAQIFAKNFGSMQHQWAHRNDSDDEPEKPSAASMRTELAEVENQFHDGGADAARAWIDRKPEAMRPALLRRLETVEGNAGVGA